MSVVLSDDRLYAAAIQHPADQELRRRGYKIYARPHRRPAVWSRGGKLYHQVNSGTIELVEVVLGRKE